MEKLRKKIVNLLRQHPEAASNIADILDYMNGMKGMTGFSSRPIQPKLYFRGYRDSLYEHRKNSQTPDFRVQKNQVVLVIEFIASRKAVFFRAGDLLCLCHSKPRRITEVYLRVVLRFLLHHKLLKKHLGVYVINSKNFQESAMKTYRQLPDFQEIQG